MRQSECHQFAHSSSTTVPFQLCGRIDLGYRGPIRKTAALLSSTTAIPVVFTVHDPNFRLHHIQQQYSDFRYLSVRLSRAPTYERILCSDWVASGQILDISSANTPNLHLVLLFSVSQHSPGDRRLAAAVAF